MSFVRTAVQAEASSKTAMILAVVTALAGLAVGLGIFGPHIEGVIIACTTDGIVVVGLIANSIHTGQIEPSAIATAVLALIGQVVALIVAFALISDATASHVLAIAASVVLAGVQIAHALWSRNIAPAFLPSELGEVKQKPVVIAQSSIKALAQAIGGKGA
ncbi:MAG TPA: hypothetical protein VGF95_14425 [Solirubrobacteraceae bacterium]|jgi:hypothetical protein